MDYLIIHERRESKKAIVCNLINVLCAFDRDNIVILHVLDFCSVFV